MRVEETPGSVEIRETWRAVAFVLLAAAALVLVRLATSPVDASNSPAGWITLALLLGLAFWYWEQQLVRIDLTARRIVWHRARLGRGRLVRDLPFGAIHDVVGDSQYGSDTIQTYGVIVVLKDGARVPLTRSYYADRETVSAVANRLKEALRTAPSSSTR